MHKGSVKWFNTTKGYGFIKPDNDAKDVFVHISALQKGGLKNLPENQRVSYNLEESNGRLSAVDLKLID